FSVAFFDDYYHPDYFKNIKDIVQDNPILSVGLDAMIVPMNGLISIDGYYVIYPLEYKHNFRRIMEHKIKDSGRESYFDKWGNRVYAFHKKEQVGNLDFCAAYHVGARFVISKYRVNSPQLHFEPLDLGNLYAFFLYRIS